jgi:hypothetical protein
MAKQTIVSQQLYPVYGPYSHAIRAGDYIFTHGTVWKIGVRLRNHAIRSQPSRRTRSFLWLATL